MATTTKDMTEAVTTGAEHTTDIKSPLIRSKQWITRISCAAAVILLIALSVAFTSCSQKEVPVPKVAVQPIQLTLLRDDIISATVDFTTVPEVYVFCDGVSVTDGIFVNKQTVTVIALDPGIYTVICVTDSKVCAGGIQVSDTAPDPEPEPQPAVVTPDAQLLQDLTGNIPDNSQLQRIAENFDNVANGIEAGKYPTQFNMLSTLAVRNQEILGWLDKESTDPEADALWYQILGAGGCLDKYFQREVLTEDTELDKFIVPLRVVAATMRQAK